MACAGLALTARPAAADVTCNTRFEFATSTTGSALAANSLTPTATGTYTFILRIGIFDLTGNPPPQANHGLARWNTAMNITGLQAGESLSWTLDPRAAPYNLPPSPTPPGPLPVTINFQRDLNGIPSAPWIYGEPEPTAPADWSDGPYGDHGIDAFFNIMRFTLTTTVLTGVPNIVVSFTGQAGPVMNWTVLDSTPPIGPGMNGIAHFTGHTPVPALRDASTSLTLVRVPAPGAMPILIAAPLTCRRRRHLPRGNSTGRSHVTGTHASVL